MRKEKALTTLLGELVALLANEADRNPLFAARLDDLLASLPERIPAKRKKPKVELGTLPDLHAELQARGEVEFRHWLRDQPIPVLRGLIRAHDLDPARRAARWKDAEKLADFIADSMRTRMARGSAFIGRGGGE